MANTFVCAMCKGEFEKGWDEAEALAELKEVWGDVSPDDCDQVCDDCWEKVKPVNNFQKSPAFLGGRANKA